MATPTSYLQTLAKDEAIAFVASLQSVKAHLSQELQWMNLQTQQKTTQLQSIEALLSEALALGLVVADTHSTTEAASVIATAAITDSTAAVATHTSALEIPTIAQVNTSIGTTDLPATTMTALPVETPSTQQHSKQGKADPPKTLHGSKPSATKTRDTKAKQAKPSPSPASKAKQRDKPSNLQRFLKSQWSDKALTESVGEILNQASAPLNTDEVMAALYDGLPKADYQRVKHSLANILSVGRSKGAWKSTGRGLYAGNAFAEA